MDATDSSAVMCARLRGSSVLPLRRWANAAVLAAVLAVCAEAREEVQNAGALTGSCPVKRSSGDDQREQQVFEWNAWTTARCDVNFAAAAAALVDNASVVCTYYDPSNLSEAQRLSAQRSCRSGTQATQTLGSAAAAASLGTRSCYDNGDCLVEFMNVKPAAEDREGEWEFRLGDTAISTATGNSFGRSAAEPVRVGALTVFSHVSTLTFDGRAEGKATPVSFATDLSSATSLRSLLFIGIDLSSAPAFPSFPESLRELHIVDCVLSELPLSRISQLKSLEKLVISRNTLLQSPDASSALLSQDQFEFLRSRSSDGSEGNTVDGKSESSCPEGYSRERLNGLPVCVSTGVNSVMAVERHLLVSKANTTTTTNLRTQNSTSSSSSDGDDEDSTTKSIYVLASFAAPGLYFLYKLGLYLYFYSTYSKHQRSVQLPMQNKNAQPDDNEDRRTTEKESSSSSPDSLVFQPPESIVLPPPPQADQRRFNNMSFWVDEELQDWRMDFNQVKILKCLTTTPNQKRHLRQSTAATALSGCEIWLGKFYPQGAPDSEQNVVLKWIPPKHKESHSPALDKFKGEIKRQAQFSHPNVVKFFGIVWSMDTHLVAVTEYMARGDLRQWLHRYATRESGKWSVQKVQILLDVAKALLYLHSMRPSLVHGNCNSRNVLLSERMKAKLSDFGSSKDLLSERELMAYSAVGSGRWISPEALVGRDSKVGGAQNGGGGGGNSAAAAADVYSLGILMSEMDTHELPFSDLMQANRAALPETDVLQLIAKGALSPTLSPTCHPGIGKLIESCTEFNPKNRPTSRDVVHALQEIIQEIKSAAVKADDSSDSDDSSDTDIVQLSARSKGVVV